MKTYFELIKESKTPEEMAVFLLEYEVYCLANRTAMPTPKPEMWLTSERNHLSILQDVMGVFNAIVGGEADES